jgi:hypothetical protein
MPKDKVYLVSTFICKVMDVVFVDQRFGHTDFPVGGQEGFPFNGQQKEGTASGGHVETYQLSQAVQEKLQKDYKGWGPAEAYYVNGQEKGDYCKVKLINAGEDEDEIVNVEPAGKYGDVIGEEGNVRWKDEHHSGNGSPPAWM